MINGAIFILAGGVIGTIFKMTNDSTALCALTMQ